MTRLPKILAVLALLAAVSCAETKDTGFPPPSPTPSEAHGPTADPTEPVETDRIEVVDNVYKPKVALVAAGTTVTWFQTGSAPHTVTFDDKSFESHPKCTPAGKDCMANGDEVTYTFEKAGSFPYYCDLHGFEGGQGMAGTVTVQ